MQDKSSKLKYYINLVWNSRTLVVLLKRKLVYICIYTDRINTTLNIQKHRPIGKIKS